MITIKQATITDTLVRADGTIDLSVIGATVVLPVNISKVIAIGINPYFEIAGVVERINSNENYLGSIAVSDNDGDFITEFSLEGSNYINIGAKQLLKEVDTKAKGGDKISLIPQFSKEVIQKFSSKIPNPFQPYMYDITRIYLDVFIQYK